MMRRLSEYFRHNFNDDVNVLTTNSYYGPGRSAFKEISQLHEEINGVQVTRFPFIGAHKKPIKFVNTVSRKITGRHLPFYIANTLHSGPLSPPLFRAMLNMDADVIGASSMHYKFADYPQWRKMGRHPKPFVLYGALHIEEGMQLNSRYIKRIRNAEYYIANTLYEKQYILRYVNDEDAIKVIGTATDIFRETVSGDTIESYRRKIGIKQDEKIILYLGRHEDWKGIPVLINAFTALQKRYAKCRLVIAGASTTYTKALLQITKENPAIIVMSDISHEEKIFILQASDIMVLPSASESFGVVFLEAWSFHKPVIGANIGAVASVIDEGKDGLLFTPGDPVSLQQQMEILLRNEDKCRELGCNGYEKVMQQYTWEKVAAAFHHVYELAVEKFNRNRNN